MDFIKRTVNEESRSSTYDRGLREYMIGVFGNMCLALIITGIVSFIVYSTPAIYQLFYAPTSTGGLTLSGLGWIITFAPIAFVFFFYYKINSMSTEMARVMLWLYSALLGLSLSPLFMAYTQESVAKVFFITASVFAVMCIYGYTAKRDLTSMASFLFMGLMGVILASLINMFLHSQAMEFVVSIISVIVFTGLTAYDVQKIANIYAVMPSGADRDKAAVLGALSLYLDFVNLFIAMLRLTGNRRS